MTFQRKISWSSAVQTLRADRASNTGLQAHLAAKGFAKIAADRARLSARTAPLVEPPRQRVGPILRLVSGAGEMIACLAIVIGGMGLIGLASLA